MGSGIGRVDCFEDGFTDVFDFFGYGLFFRDHSVRCAYDKNLVLVGESQEVAGGCVVAAVGGWRVQFMVCQDADGAGVGSLFPDAGTVTLPVDFELAEFPDEVVDGHFSSGWVCRF